MLDLFILSKCIRTFAKKIIWWPWVVMILVGLTSCTTFYEAKSAKINSLKSDLLSTNLITDFTAFSAYGALNIKVVQKHELSSEEIESLLAIVKAFATVENVREAVAESRGIDVNAVSSRKLNSGVNFNIYDKTKRLEGHSFKAHMYIYVPDKNGDSIELFDGYKTWE